jgi:HlyD family secretion protein
MNDPSFSAIPGDGVASPTHDPALQPIRILIVDDQNFVRKMLQYSLADQTHLKVIGTANSGQDALAQIEHLQPDIALVDIEMPGMNGLEMTRTVLARYPQTKVLVLSIHDDVDYIRDALQAGAKGYLLKNTPPAELAHAIRFVQLGYLQLGPGLFEKLEQSPASLYTPPTDNSLSPSLNPPSPTDIATLAVNPLELDWSVATQDVVNTLPRLWARGLLYLMLALTAVVLPWAALSQVEEVGTAQGKLEPKGKTIRLDAPVAGTVSAIRAQEGQAIQQGQPLMELQSDIVNADLQQAQAKLDGLLNRKTQLIAIKAQLKSSLAAAQQQIRAQAVSQQATIDKARKQQTSLQDALSLAQELLIKDKSKVASLSNLSKQGAIPRSQVEDAERIMIQNNQQLQRTRTDIQQAQAEVQKQQSEYQQILNEGELSLMDKAKQTEEIESQVIDTQAEADQTQNLIKSLQYQRQQRILYAPASGTLFQLLVQHPGAVVQPGQAIAQIAPKTARLVLRARMDNRQTGFIKVGLPVKLKLDAYPFQDYGILPGRVSWIAPTSSQPDRSTSSSPSPSTDRISNGLNNSFEIEVELSQANLKMQEKSIILKAGQTATAEVIVRRRRVLDLFLDPFRKLKDSNLSL